MSRRMGEPLACVSLISTPAEPLIHWEWGTWLRFMGQVLPGSLQKGRTHRSLLRTAILLAMTFGIPSSASALNTTCIATPASSLCVLIPSRPTPSQSSRTTEGRREDRKKVLSVASSLQVSLALQRVIRQRGSSALFSSGPAGISPKGRGTLDGRGGKHLRGSPCPAIVVRGGHDNVAPRRVSNNSPEAVEILALARGPGVNEPQSASLCVQNRAPQRQPLRLHQHLESSGTKSSEWMGFGQTCAMEWGGTGKRVRATGKPPSLASAETSSKREPGESVKPTAAGGEGLA